MAKRKKWQELFLQARRSLKKGQRSKARRLARKVVTLAPNREAPWLLLAATATPKASIGYLKQALSINPKSKRARQGLRWAKKRIKEKHAANTYSVKQSPAGSLALPQVGSSALIIVAALTLSFALFAWLRPPGMDQGLRVVSAAAAKQVHSLFASQTPSSSPTPTASPTQTPSLTATPSPSFTPSETPTSTPSLSPTLPLPTETPVPTNGPDSAEAQAKFRVDLPEGLEENERWIDINLSAQTVTAYKGNQVQRTFIVSTGRSATPTVVGEFRIWVKVRLQDMSGPGYYIRDVPYVMYFYEDYSIHGTHWHNNFGTPMSAGCVNMTIDDSYWMYQFASVGTIVKVHY